ncbi:MAG: SgcJ/EcaC family oxidoreductase [Mycobacteriaceae bacterium]|nr:SgcJ/EcaC family oxidoreductase [Mycobacteriaceae bacterium]
MTDDTTRQADDIAIRTLLDHLNDAWARADAEAYGDGFTADADYVTFVGTHFRGRSDIVESHRVLWRKFLKGTRLASEVTGIRFLADDVALVHSKGAVLKGKQQMTKRNTKVQTMIAVRDNDRWRFAAFQNTKYHWLMEAISFRFAPDSAPAQR